MYEIWNKKISIPKISELKKVKSEHSIIKAFEPETDGCVFLHGVALVKFKGRIYCSWAHNKVLENSDDEEVNFAFSDDKGKTWSDFIYGNMKPEKEIAVSHGSFLIHDDKLYFFAPQFKGQLGAQMLKMGVYILNEATGRFSYLGIALNQRFWPMCEPILMENGNYIMSGIYVGSDYYSSDNTAAVAISRGADVLHWDMIKIEKAEGVKVWGECSIITDHNHCKMYCREHSGKRVVLYSESQDFGQTWSKLDLTNMPMIDSKPYAGTLSDGRNYLICSCAEDIETRNPLTIALTQKGKDEFCEIYSIDTGKIFSYPYAIEAENKLYIAYSSTTEGGNRNNAELSIINIGDLTK